ncbi:uncharacterized protein DUF4868 [Sinobaca qinghaiensis]|uniref:Uncharacterized protein DUF4868 n=1 Tax=Sinobaca qinghaiensis TaxID=342944 RepID=A0A419V5J4_9BACL|nr:Kiwa anti-phage protein KwaB-like domain-containing protein [Sinobaca qinghaiensis]RKD75218.1 uncharacterized protein DUF4868 [Sinobaca qinghaiensis]
MDIQNVISLIDERKEDNSNVRLYFTNKKRKNSYESFSPSLSEDLQEEIVKMALNSLRYYEEVDQKKFSPIGQVEGFIETIPIGEVESYTDIINSFREDYVFRQSPNHKQINDLNFYCLKIEIEEEEDIYLFRRVNKFKKLSEAGIIGRFSGENDFIKFRENILGLDGNIDILVYNDEILILNHIALERVFSISDQFLDNAQKTLKYVEDKNRIENFEAFKEDCLSNKRITRILTKILDEQDKMEIVFENFENVINVINTFELKIELAESNTKIIYDNKDQLMNITYLIRDSFYKSIIGDRGGRDESI